MGFNSFGSNFRVNLEQLRISSIKFFFSRKFVRDRDKYTAMFLLPQFCYIGFRLFEPDEVIHERYHEKAKAIQDADDIFYFNATNKDTWDVLQSESVINFPR